MSPERVRLEVVVEQVDTLGPNDIEAYSGPPIELSPIYHNTMVAFFDLMDEHNGRIPTIRELADRLEKKSTNTISRRIDRLITLGCLHENHGAKSRDIFPRITRNGFVLKQSE